MSTPGNRQDAFGSQDPYGQQPPYGQPSAQENAWQDAPGGPSSAPDPYGAQSPYAQPSAQEDSWQQAPSYVGPSQTHPGVMQHSGPQDQYGGAPHGGYAPPQPPPDAGSIQGQAIAQIVLGLLCGGMIPAILGIVALVQMNTDPAGARKLLKIGWILFAVFAAIILVIVALQFIVPLILLVVLGTAGAV